MLGYQVIWRFCDYNGLAIGYANYKGYLNWRMNQKIKIPYTYRGDLALIQQEVDEVIQDAMRELNKNDTDFSH